MAVSVTIVHPTPDATWYGGNLEKTHSGGQHPWPDPDPCRRGKRRTAWRWTTRHRPTRHRTTRHRAAARPQSQRFTARNCHHRRAGPAASPRPSSAATQKPLWIWKPHRIWKPSRIWNPPRVQALSAPSPAGPSHRQGASPATLSQRLQNRSEARSLQGPGAGFPWPLRQASGQCTEWPDSAHTLPLIPAPPGPGVFPSRQTDSDPGRVPGYSGRAEVNPVRETEPP